jgi:hypothetical protein
VLDGLAPLTHRLFVRCSDGAVQDFAATSPKLTRLRCPKKGGVTQDFNSSINERHFTICRE